MKINIDKEIDAGRCPTIMFCTVATTSYEPIEREHICYKCWLAYCKEHNIILKPNIELASYSLVVEFAKIGLGIGYVTKLYIEKELR